MPFLVSVIIPAYNVERFIEKAILSALKLEEVNEVIVVDDGSADNTVTLIRSLQENDSRIKLFFHPNKINKGRSATRNLGIQKSTGNYIAFLDADDFYLENRFKKDRFVFEKKKDIEGVYNAVGFYYYKNSSEDEKRINKISTLSQVIEPEMLFDCLISSKYGYLHLDGLTIKKSVFEKIGFFNEVLVVAEDSDLIFKLALKCKLVSSNIENPIALRGIHDSNVFTRIDLYKIYNAKLYESILYWSCDNSISVVNIDKILKWLWIFKFKEKNSLLTDIWYWTIIFFKKSKLLFSYLSIKYFPVIRLRQELFPFLFKSK